LGTISGIKSVYPTKRLGVVWIDAHADLHSPYTSPSGKFMGCRCQRLWEKIILIQVNEINPDTAQRWEDLKNIGVHGTKISPENLIYFGSAIPKKQRKARLKN
jgi:arginase